MSYHIFKPRIKLLKPIIVPIQALTDKNYNPIGCQIGKPCKGEYGSERITANELLKFKLRAYLKEVIDEVWKVKELLEMDDCTDIKYKCVFRLKR